MARTQLELSIDDLHVLAEIVAERPRSMLAAANHLGMQRTQLLRLVERANRRVNRKGPWRDSTGIVPPPELRRLVRAYERFRAELDLSICSPVVSTGPSAATLLGEVACKAQLSMRRAAFIRTRSAIGALRQDEIDIALLHGSSLRESLKGRDLPEDLVQRDLLKWRPVRARLAERAREGAMIAMQWEPGSLGERLANAYSAVRDDGSRLTTWPCDSFLLALDLLRRGVVAEVVAPDIYVPADSTLVVESIPDAAADSLVALIRRADAADWDTLLDERCWQAVRPEAERVQGGKSPATSQV